MAPLIWCRGVEKRFGKTPALRGADLAVSAGEIVAIMGPSGSGKSTLLQCLAGIQMPDAGEVGFGAERIESMDSRARTLLRRTSFGFMFQFGDLVPELTALENVALPLLLDGRDRGGSFHQANSWLDRVSVGHLAESLPGQLSGGE